MAKKRANGEGSIYKSGNKYRAGVIINGKRTTKYFAKHEEALAWRDEQLHENRQGIWVAPNDLTLIQWSLHFLETYKKPPMTVWKTYDTYIAYLKHLKSVGDMKIQDVKPIYIQELINNMEVVISKKVEKTIDGKKKMVLTETRKAAATATRAKFRRLLHMIFKQAVLEGFCKSNPIIGVAAPKVVQDEVEVFKDEELPQLLVPPIKKPELHILVLMALGAGMRPSEILGLNIKKHFNYDDKTISIVEGVHERSNGAQYFSPPKSLASKRTLKISKTLSDKIHEISKHSTYLCVKADGTPIFQSTLEKWWRNFLAEKKLPYRKFYALRHTHATKLLLDGTPILEVSARLGHAKPSITLDVYGHACKQAGKLQLESSERLFGI